MTPPLVIWLITDGKPGHLNQMQGLSRALGGLIAVDTHRVDAPARRDALRMLASGSFAPGQGLPDPELILCAGHGTHLAALAARRARGGRLVVLMRPSLPIGWFDACIAPAHDDPPMRDSVLATRGVINNVQRSSAQDAGAGLFLIGGPSKHHGWDDAGMARQVAQVVERCALAWTLTTSRRTPPGFLDHVAPLREKGLRVTPLEKTDAAWMRDRFAASGVIWVSEDSVSMVYEAITSGARVGLLRAASRGEGRVQRGVEDLLREGWATAFETWERTGDLPAAPGELNEAGRAARWIVSRWFAGDGAAR